MGRLLKTLDISTRRNYIALNKIKKASKMKDESVLELLYDTDVGDYYIFDINEKSIGSAQNIRAKLYGYEKFKGRKYKTFSFLDKIFIVRVV